MTTECCRQRWLLSARQVQSKFFRLAGARRSDKVERNLAVTIDVKARDDRRCVVLALIVQWFQRNRYQLAHCAKARFQAQGRKMRTLAEGH